MLKKYKVVWEEKHSVIITAKNEAEAINIIAIGDYKEENEASEISGSPEAYEMEKGKDNEYSVHFHPVKVVVMAENEEEAEKQAREFLQDKAFSTIEDIIKN